jgi:hypothetical protein
MGHGNDDPEALGRELALWRRLRNETRAQALDHRDFDTRSALLRISSEYDALAKRVEQKLSGPNT